MAGVLDLALPTIPDLRSPPTVSDHQHRPRPTLPRRVPVVLGGVLAGLGLLFGGLLLAEAGGVPRNTSVLGVPIGGLSPDDAAEALQAGLGNRATAPIPVTVAGRAVQVDPTAAGLSLDVDATVAAASAASRNPLVLLGRWLGGTEVAPVVAVDGAALAAAVERIATTVDQAPREGGVAVRGTTATAVQPVPGRVLDRDRASATIRAAYLAGGAPVSLPVTEHLPTVDSAEVQRTPSRHCPPRSGWSSEPPSWTCRRPWSPGS
jgi:hypothetical protein